MRFDGSRFEKKKSMSIRLTILTDYLQWLLVVCYKLGRLVDLSDLSRRKHLTNPSPPAVNTPSWMGRTVETPTEAKAPPPRGVRNLEAACAADTR